MLNWMAIASNGTQRILSQANNISYAARDSYRMGAVPENRKADYIFRHFYMVPVCALLTEMGFRVAEKFYTMPQLTRVMGLKTLLEKYGPQSNDPTGMLAGVPAEQFPRYRSLSEIPFLKNRLAGSLAKNSSTSLLPNLVKTIDLPAQSPEVQAQGKVLLAHLDRLINFDTEGGFLDSLIKGNKLTQAEADIIKQGTKDMAPIRYAAERLARRLPKVTEGSAMTMAGRDIDVLKEGLGYLEKYMPEVARQLTSLKERLSQGAKKIEVQGKELTTMAKAVQELGDKGLLERLSQGARDIVKYLINEGANNKNIVLELKAIQKTSFWPKMFVSTALNLVFYGILQSWLDVNVIQPWQKKLYEKRGTTNEVVAPVYWGVIPFGLGLMAVMSDKIAPKFIQKLGPVSRFTVGAFAALAAYTATTFGMIGYRLSKPPKNPPPMPMNNPSFASGSQLINTQPLRHPSVFRAFEQARQA